MKINFKSVFLSCFIIFAINMTMTMPLFSEEYKYCTAKPKEAPKEKKDCKDNAHCAHYDFGWKDLEYFTIGGEWLYWKNAQDGLNYGTLSQTIPLATSTVVRDKELKPDFRYTTGYRVFAGFELPCYAWDIKAVYTHVPTNAQSKVTAALPGQSISLNPNILFFNPVTGLLPSGPGVVLTGNSVQTKWFSDMNYVDVDLSHTLFEIESLRFRPHFGVRYLWSNQTFDVTYQGTIGGSPVPTFTLISHLRNRNWGCGVEGGLWLDWNLGYGFTLLGQLGGSIMYSKLHVRGEMSTFSTTSATESYSDYVDHIYSCLPMLDYFIGLEYLTCLADGEVYFRAGWEQHVIFNANRFTIIDQGSLSMQGFTLGGGVIF